MELSNTTHGSATLQLACQGRSSSTKDLRRSLKLHSLLREQIPAACTQKLRLQGQNEEQLTERKHRQDLHASERLVDMPKQLKLLADEWTPVMSSGTSAMKL